MSAEVLRVREGGEVSQRIPVETQAFACMLGGPGRRHLFICTALDHEPEKCRETRSGRIEVVEVEVPGAGLPARSRRSGQSLPNGGRKGPR